jgi:hypothetical protein
MSITKYVKQPLKLGKSEIMRRELNRRIVKLEDKVAELEQENARLKDLLAKEYSDMLDEGGEG